VPVRRVSKSWRSGIYLNHKDLSKYIVLDVEADGLHPTQIWCGVAKNAATKQKWELRGQAEVKRFISEAPPDTMWVGHNALSYDFPHCNRLLGTTVPVRRIVDTLILSYLYNPRLAGGHGLDDWAVRLRLPQQKDYFDDFSKFSEELLARCSTDVDINLEVFLRLTAKMRDIGYSEESCGIEHEFRAIINRQQRNGFFFDIPGANTLLGQLRHRESSLAEPIRELFPRTLASVKTFKYKERADGRPYQSYLRHVNAYPKVERDGEGNYTCYDYEDFNIGSPQQRIEKLLSLGWKPQKFTKKTRKGGGGSPKVDEESLVAFAKESGIPEVQMIADWLVENGRGNMVQTWLDNVNREDSRIHGTVFSCGAQSRRCTHSAPNTANIPSNEAKYGHECRSLWRASPGLVLVGYDAKALQMRIFGHYLNDWDTARLYLEGDPHQRNADSAGIPRKKAKNCFYAMIFGAQDAQLGYTGIDKAQTKAEAEAAGGKIRKALYSTTPGLERAVKESQAEYKKNDGRLKCIDGGWVVCPSAHSTFNYWIQPGEACIMKKGAIFLDKHLKRDGVWHQKVGDIHDEGQHETKPPDAQRLGERAAQSLTEAGEHFNLRVPMAGDFKVGATWADTH